MNQILMAFAPCFTEPAHRSFICAVMGFILRSDNRGIASFIRALHLDPLAYHSLDYFFKSSSFSLAKVSECWYRMVFSIAPIHRYQDFILFTGDGVKTSKEGRRMAGVKKLHQESENSSKGEFINGHMFGGTSILAGNRGKLFSIPLSLRLHDGIKAILPWSKESGGHLEEWRSQSHVVQMVHQSFEAASFARKNAILLLDRYFPTVPAFQALEALNAKAEGFKTHIVSKMKISAVAYEVPPGPTGKRGRPRLKGDRVKLREVFELRKEDFTREKAYLYGAEEEARILTMDLLWGQGHYRKYRFVLVEYKGMRSIFISTNSQLSGREILELYGYRFKIECTFRELKQVVDAFGYRFWNKSMPRLNRYKKKGNPDPLESVIDEAAQKNILKTIRAIEMFVLCGCIALGSLQICSLKYGNRLELWKKVVYLRSYTNGIASEATMAEYIRNQFYALMGHGSKLGILKKIRFKQSVEPLASAEEMDKAA